MWVTLTRRDMAERTTARAVVEHVVETDEQGVPRIGARQVVDETPAPAAERETESGRARVSGR
jgi:hypothetical protein